MVNKVNLEHFWVRMPLLGVSTCMAVLHKACIAGSGWHPPRCRWDVVASDRKCSECVWVYSHKLDLRSISPLDCAALKLHWGKSALPCPPLWRTLEGSSSGCHPCSVSLSFHFLPVQLSPHPLSLPWYLLLQIHVSLMESKPVSLLTSQPGQVGCWWSFCPQRGISHHRWEVFEPFWLSRHLLRKQNILL